MGPSPRATAGLGKHWTYLGLLITGANLIPPQIHAQEENALEEIVVVEERIFRDTTVISPTSRITANEFKHINVVTVEDTITYEPSVIVRRRFIGDPNGVVGIRGSNMFQGTRSMVFVDGMPLHYHLQTRFSGSPRWSLVAPGEISAVEVIYGPFSAEYSGNAMGGVVNIATKNPAKREVRIEGTLFSQQYDILATNDEYNGGKLFMSYEDRLGDLSIFASYNRLQNDSQPMTQFFSAPSSRTASAIAESGAIAGMDEFEEEGVYYGDSGPEEATTDLYKLKLRYDLGGFQLRGSVAYEERQRNEAEPNNYLRDASGNPIWDRNFTIMSDPNATVYDTTSFGTSVFQNRRQERESLLVGLGLSGELGDTGWLFDTHYSNFQILDDVEIRTGRNPADPDFESANATGDPATYAGRITVFDDTGWQILDIKAGTESLFGNDDMRLSLGYHYDFYELEINPFRYDAFNGIRGNSRGSSGGEANTHAVFAQWGMAVAPKWDLALGMRYESWDSDSGFFGDPGNPDDQQPDRSESGTSPKFSTAYMPTEDTTIRYSAARALRFPIVEELYRNEDSGISQFLGDATLEPEDGFHQNLSFEKLVGSGSVTVNVFHEVIDDVIFNFTETANSTNITTALPVDEVTTKGIEFITIQPEFLDSKFGVRFNVSYTDAEITENRLNPSIVGNEFPRMPEWRSNLLVSYPAGQKVDLSVGLRYASDSYGSLDNMDTADNVFGAQDDFLFANLRANWEVSEIVNLSFGVDNVTNEEAYVFHPWPSRTYYLETKLGF